MKQGTRRTESKDEKPLPSPASLKSLPPVEGFIPPHGGYEQLHSFQKSRIVYDGTVHFCDRFIDRRSRTHDQMVQAARSGTSVPEVPFFRAIHVNSAR